MTCTHRPEVGHPFGQRPLTDPTLDLQWRLTGAQDTDEDQGNNDTDDTDDDDEQAEPDDATDGDTEDSDDDDDDHKVALDELKTKLAEAEQMTRIYKRKMQLADSRASKAEAKLRGTGGKPEAPAAQDEPKDDDVARELAALRAEVAEQKVRDLFYASTKYTWQDPATAYRLLDTSDVRDADGKVDREALDDAQAALAKASPFLLKTAETPKPKGDRPTGQQPGTHRRDGKPDMTKLATKYGALRSRS